MSPVGRHGVAWCIGGTAGEGLESGGEIFAHSLAAAGQRPSTQRDFPSRIRGGDTTFTVRLTPGGHLAPPTKIDLALMFNASVVPRLFARLDDDSLLLLDEGVEGVDAPCPIKHFPFTRLATGAGDKRAKNMVALGASAAIMGASLESLEAAIDKRFGRKGAEMVAINKAALHAGHDLAATEIGVRNPLPEPVEGAALLLSGNESLSLGAIAAGVQVAAAYPITPASDILEFLTPRITQLGGVALQMEDEMAALNVCIGAGFAGKRSLTATSGPGLSLMTETVGLAESTETPVVIVDCQRPGPSTGMPTKHAQDDIWHLCHGGHSEGVRIVLAPTDVADAHATCKQAFALADSFHCPVFVAMDQQMSLMKQTIGPLDSTPHQFPDRPTGAAADAWTGTYKPYGDSGADPAPRGRPGEAWGMHLSNSTEHGPSGLTTEDPAIRTAMMQRRLDRMAAIPDAVEAAIEVHGDAANDVVVTFGSTVGATLEAARRSEKTVRVIAVRLLWPLPVEAINSAIGEASRIVIPEANAMGQFASLLKSELPIHDRIVPVTRFDGIPISSDDILEALQ